MRYPAARRRLRGPRIEEGGDTGTDPVVESMADTVDAAGVPVNPGDRPGIGVLNERMAWRVCPPLRGGDMVEAVPRVLVP